MHACRHNYQFLNVLLKLALRVSNLHTQLTGRSLLLAPRRIKAIETQDAPYGDFSDSQLSLRMIHLKGWIGLLATNVCLAAKDVSEISF